MTSRRATSSRKCGPCASRPRPQHCAPSCRPRKISCPLPSPLDLLCDLSRVRGEADGSGQFLAPPLGRHLEQVPSTTMYTHSPKCFQINCSWKNPSRINQNPPFCLFPKYRVSTVAVMFECEFHGACVCGVRGTVAEGCAGVDRSSENVFGIPRMQRSAARRASFYPTRHMFCGGEMPTHVCCVGSPWRCLPLIAARAFKGV